VRDQAFEKLTAMLITNKQWFMIELAKPDETPEMNLTKNIRRVWEGLFYSKYSRYSHISSSDMAL
jgi:hypothetical protein